MYIQQKFKNEVADCFARKGVKCYNFLVWFHSRLRYNIISQKGQCCMFKLWNRNQLFERGSIVFIFNTLRKVLLEY